MAHRGTPLIIWNEDAANAGGARYTSAHTMALIKFRGGPSKGRWNNFPPDSKMRQTVQPQRNKIVPIKMGDVRLNATQKCLATEKYWFEKHMVDGEWAV